MNGNSAIYMGDDGNYHDKPKDWTEPAPEPTEDGEGVQIPAEDDNRPLGEVLNDPEDDRASMPAEEAPKARTRKQS